MHLGDEDIASLYEQLEEHRVEISDDCGREQVESTYINGDQVSCLIDTGRGRVLRAEHDVSSLRPYSRINTLAG